METMTTRAGETDPRIKSISLTVNTRGKRSAEITKSQAEYLSQLQDSERGERLANNEILVITIMRTSEVQFQTKPLSKSAIQIFLKDLIENPDYHFGSEETKYLNYLLRNFARTGRWWHGLTDVPGDKNEQFARVRRRADVMDYVNKRLQAVIRDKSTRRARVSIMNKQDAINNPTSIGLQIRVGKVEYLGVVG